MKRAVSVSLGASSRDKKVPIEIGGQQILLERIGHDGDPVRTRRTFAELDGKVDALGMGGTDLYLRLQGREYPLYAVLKLVQDVKHTPVVDGGGLKQTLERRVFQLAAPQLHSDPHFRRAFIPLAIDRTGLAEAVSTVITNTTTEADVELLRECGVRTVIPTTPRYQGRSFGTNALEAALTAYAGYGRPLDDAELNGLIDEFNLRPSVQHLTS